MSGPKSSGTVQHIFRQWMEKITSKFGGERNAQLNAGDPSYDKVYRINKSLLESI
jgi:hypothetical protein